MNALAGMNHRRLRILEAGLIFLVIFTPLAFGTVHFWAYTFMEMVLLFLVAVYLLGVLRTNRGRLPSLPSAFIILAGVFLLVTVIQLIPLPPQVARAVSPARYELYERTAVDEREANSLSLSSGSGESSLPLSLAPYATKGELLKIIAYFLFFFLVVSYCRGRRRMDRLLTAMVTVGFGIAVLGLLQDLSATKKLFWIWDASYSTPYGSYVNKNHFAGYMEAVIPLAMAQAVLAREWRKRIRLWSFLAVMIVALLFSLSRGGVLAFLFSMLTFGVLLQLFLGSRKYTLPFVGGLIAAFLLLLFAGTEPVAQRLGTLLRFQDVESFQMRQDVWKETWHIFQDYPILGTGLGTFSSIFPSHQGPKYEVFFTHTENEYLQTLSETGFVGFAAILGLVVVVLVRIFSGLRATAHSFERILAIGGISSAFAVLFHGFSDFNLHIPANALVFVAALGLAYSAVTRSRQESQYTTSSTTWLVAARLALALIGGVITFSVASETVAWFHYRHYQSLQAAPVGREGDGTAALMAKAESWSRGNPLYSYLLAGSYMQTASAPLMPGPARTELYALAGEKLRKAINLEPANSWYHMGLGWFYSYLGKEEAANKRMKLALSLAPNNLQMKLAYARWALNQYRFVKKEAYLNQAAAGYLEALSLAPRYTKEAVEALWWIKKDYHLVRRALPADDKVHSFFYSFLVSIGQKEEAQLEDKVVKRLIKSQALRLIAQFKKSPGPLDQATEARFRTLLKGSLEENLERKLLLTLAEEYRRSGNKWAARLFDAESRLRRVSGPIGLAYNDIVPVAMPLMFWGYQGGLAMDSMPTSLGMDLGQPCNVRLIRLNHSRAAPTRLRPAQLLIYQADDNEHYRLYKGPSSSVELVALGSRVLAFFDLELEARYIKINYVGSSRGGTFVNQVPEMLEVFCDRPDVAPEKPRVAIKQP